MQSFDKGRIVRSINGHDAGNLYMVLGERDGRVLLADGHLKKRDAPKRKNPKHLTDTGAMLFTGRLTEGGAVTDTEIRHALKEYRKQIEN